MPKKADVQTDAIVALYQMGLSMRVVAARLGTTHDVVQGRLAQAGIKRRTYSEWQRGTKRPERERRVDWSCPHCGRIVRLMAHVAKERVFCSETCRRRHEHVVQPKQPRPTKVCATCSQPYTVQSLYKAGRRKYCSHACAMYDLHQQRRSGHLRAMERIVEALLLGLGLDYVPQWRIGTLSADFYLPAFCLPIECDGTWWHALPTKVREDLRKERAYANAGLRVLHISENEVMGDLPGVKRSIQQAIIDQGGKI